MKLWPFGGEKRASYTEAHVNAILAAALGASADASKTAAAATAALLWARTLAAADVEPAILRRTVTPQWLATVGADVVLRGQHLSMIDVDGGISLRRAYSWDVSGIAPPWYWRADLPSPAGSVTRSSPGAGVVFVPWQESSAEPWRGVSPLVLAGFTADGLGKVEAALAQELGTTTGYVLPVPVDGQDSTLDGLRSELKTLKGGLSLAETTVGGWGQGRQAAPQKDLGEPTRLGAHPPDSLVKVRGDLAADVLAACGIPAALVGASGEGTARRAALSMFVDFVVAPFARLLESELSEKLEEAVTLDLSRLTRADTTLTKARAAAQLVGAGVAVEEALTSAGLRE